jgi:hypothetical protein
MDRAAPELEKAAPVKTGSWRDAALTCVNHTANCRFLTAKPGRRGDPPLGEDSCAAMAA